MTNTTTKIDRLVSHTLAPRRIKFGLVGRFGGPERQTNADRFSLIEEAEDLGFSAFWLNEEHFQDYARLGSSPLVIGAAIASKTTHMRIGTAVVLLPLHHPVTIAEDFATLDILSDGRVDVGFSRGGQPRYFEGFGIAQSDRIGRYEESLAIVMKAWTEDRFSFDGKYFKLPEVAIRPGPVQRPHPPIFVATYDIDNVRECARSGLRVLEGGVESPTAVKRKVDAFQTAWTAAGHPEPPPDIPVSRTLYVGEDDASAWRDVEEYLRQAYSTRNVRGAPLPFEVESRDTAIVGGPETVLEKLIALHDDCGVRYVNLLVHSFWYVPADLMRASMRRLARYVMPHFVS